MNGSPGLRAQGGRGSALVLVSTAAWAVPAIALVALVAWSVVPLNRDSAILLDCGRELIRGGVPYVDYVETNPPLSHYIHALPALVAERTGAGLAIVFQWCVLGMVAFSAISLSQIPAGERVPAADLSRPAFLAGTWLCFSLAVLSTVDFGQREHLFTLAFVPWVFLRIHRAGSSSPARPSTVLAGLVALFVLLKPHFLILLLGVEAWLVLRTRRWEQLLRPELLVLLAAGIAYAGHFFLVPQEMRQAFFGRWMPFVAANYAAYDSTWTQVLFNPKAVPPLLVALCGWAMSRRLPADARLEFETFGVAILLAWLICLLQGKGWGYHLIPAWGLGFLFAGLQAQAWANRGDWTGQPDGRWRWSRGATMGIGAGICLVLLSIALAVLGQVNGRAEWRRVEATLASIRSHSAVDQPIAFISTDVADAYPALIYSGRPAGTRYLCAFPIAMFYRGMEAGPGHPKLYRTAGQRSAEEERFLAELGADIGTNRPALVLVPQGRAQGCPPGFSIDEYLHETGWFARFMSGYRRLPEAGRFATYVRIGESRSAFP